jgi:hypothetical protein
MTRTRAAICAALVSGCLGLGLGAQAQQKEGVRPEVGKPLQAAQALVKQKKGREAMAEIAKAEAVPNRTAYENQVIAQMKAAAASSAGDNDLTIRNNEALLLGGKVSGRDALPLIQGVAVAYYNKRDYAQAASWTNRYFKEGGNDAAMRQMLLQSYYLGNDCNSVNKMLGSLASEEATRRPPRRSCRSSPAATSRRRTTPATSPRSRSSSSTIRRPPTGRTCSRASRRSPAFPTASRCTSSGCGWRPATSAPPTTTWRWRSSRCRRGCPRRRSRSSTRATRRRCLGTGPQAERHQRLRDLVKKSLDESQKNRAKEEQEAVAAKEGNDLVKIGMNYVFEGKADKGIQLIEQGIKKGGLKRPEDAKLALGYAQVHAGQRGKGVQTLKTVQGNDGTADIARLWVLHTRA